MKTFVSDKVSYRETQS